MPRPPESDVNRVLAELRREAGVNNRRIHGEHMVADILPPEGKARFLSYLVAHRVGLKKYIVDECVRELVCAGYFQPHPGVKRPRWVRLGEDDFSYDSKG